MQEVKAGVEPLTLTNLPLHCAHPLGLLGSWDMDGNPTSRPPPPSPGPEPHISHADRFVHRTTGHVHWPWASVGDETKIFGGTDGCLGQSWTQHSDCYRKTEKCHKKYILFQHCSRRTMPWMESWRTQTAKVETIYPDRGGEVGGCASNQQRRPINLQAPRQLQSHLLHCASTTRRDNSHRPSRTATSNFAYERRLHPPSPASDERAPTPSAAPPPRSRPDTHRRHDNLLLLHL